VARGDRLCTLHANREVGDGLEAAFTIADAPPSPRPLIIEKIG